MLNRLRNPSTSKLIAIILHIFIATSEEKPQRPFRRNLFIDQIASESGDSVLLIGNLPHEKRSSDPFLDTIVSANSWPYHDQIAMESHHPPTGQFKAISFERSPTSLRNMRPASEPSKYRQYKRGPYRDNPFFNSPHQNNGGYEEEPRFASSSHREEARAPLYPPSSFRGESRPYRSDERDGTIRCPEDQNLLPCKCQLKGSEIHVKCDGSSINKVRQGLATLMNSLLKVSELHLVGNSLRHIPSRFFGSLQVNKLFLLDNDLSTISRNSFAGLESSLEHLFIRDKTLYDLPFDTLDNLNNLQTFVLENTLVSEIPRLYSHSKLEFFKIDGSRITSIPSAAFRLMTKMKKVHLSNSKIKEIGESSFEGLVYLKELNLSNNAIEWIHPRAFRTMEILEEISLQGNSIKDAAMPVLASREVASLKRLDLSKNEIKSLSKGSFVDMKNVQEIKLNENKLSTIAPGAFSKLPRLRVLELNNNLLHDLHADIFDQVPNIEELKASANNISHVSDMKFIVRTMPNLMILDLSDNSLELNNGKKFEGHQKLEVLKLNANEISELQPNTFQLLPKLKELHLSHNRIGSDVSEQIWNLPNIKLLDISHNDLNSLTPLFLLGLPQLSTLDVGFNIISNIEQETLMEVPYLRSFNMSFNKIRSLPPSLFKGLRDLYELDISYNGLSELDQNMFHGLSSLENLYITHNQIMKIHPGVFRDTSKLKHLDLSTNILQELPHEALKDLPSLRHLNIRRNAINIINDGELSGLKVVERLDLSHNHIQTLGKDAFKDTTVLRDLDLSINYIQDLHPNMFSNMKLLERLNISHNFVSNLGDTPFENAKRLRILDMTNNSLTFISDSVGGLTSLQGLFLSHNYIDKLGNNSFLDLPNLNVLYFDNNGLQQFEPGTFDNLSSLVYLDLGNNNLVELNSDSFRSQRSLKELKLHKNQISTIRDFAFTDLFSIQSIELQENLITDISNDAFDMMPTLKFLNISKNGLQEVPVAILKKFPSLDVLDLSWNFILEIEDSSFKDLEWLTVLMLHSNDLCRLSDGSFSKQKGLRVLTLNNNQLRKLHLKALGKTIKGLSLLDMSENPFSCDCELFWLREYIEEEEEKMVETRMAIARAISGGMDERPNNLLKSQQRTFSRFRDSIEKDSEFRRRSAQYERESIESRAPLSSWMREDYLRDLHNVGRDRFVRHSDDDVPSYLLSSTGRAFTSQPQGMVATISELPMPLRKIPVCSGPQKYKGLPITEVPASAFLCNSSPNSIDEQANACVPRFLDLPGGIELETTGPTSSGSFLDYNDPIVVPHLAGRLTTNISTIADTVTPPPPYSTTTTIIAVTTTPSDVDVQVTQQLSHKISSQDKVQQSLDYNVVTGDTPTIYAGNPSGETDIQETTTISSGVFGSLPSLSSVFETIGSISNLQLPNIGLNVNWADMPIGRIDSDLASKMGTVETETQEKKSKKERPPFWVDGPNGPILNPAYVPNDTNVVPNLKNPEKIYPASFLSSLLPALSTSRNSQIKSSTIIFPDSSTGRGGPNPDNFRFPDDPPKLDARGQPGFTFPGFSSFSIPESETSQKPALRKPLPAVVHRGPGQNSGTPFLPGLTPKEQNKGPVPSHIIGLRSGVGTVSKIPLERKTVWNVQSPKREIKWSKPESVNPLSGVSLYQPSEQFQPYHPPNNNNPIKIIAPPNHSNNPNGFRPPRPPMNTFGINQPVTTYPENSSETQTVFLENADILTYANPSELHQEEKILTVDTVPIVPELADDTVSEIETYDEGTPKPLLSSTVDRPVYKYPDYDYHGNYFSSTESIKQYDYYHSQNSAEIAPETIDTEHNEGSAQNVSSAFPVKINDDSFDFDDTLDILHAAEKEVVQDEPAYDLSLIETAVNDSEIQDQSLNVNSSHIDIDLLDSDLFIDQNASLSYHDYYDRDLPTYDLDINVEISDYDVPPAKEDNIGVLIPSHGVPTTETNVASSTLPPFQITTPKEETTTFVPTHHSLQEFSQRPPTVYGTIRKDPQKVVLSESKGSEEDYGPPNLGAGVSVLQGKLSPDKIEELQQETSGQSSRNNDELPLPISPDINPAPLIHSEEGLLEGQTLFPEETSVIKSSNSENKVNETDTINNQLLKIDEPEVYEEEILTGPSGFRDSDVESDLPQTGLFTGFGIPSVNKVHPPGVSVLDVSHSADHFNNNQPPSLEPALAPPQDEDIPYIALQQHHEALHDQTQPKTQVEIAENPYPEQKFGTLEETSNEKPVHASSKTGIDWYYNNYHKDYGNNTQIPTGRNKLVVSKSHSNSLVCSSFTILLSFLVYLWRSNCVLG